MLQVEERFGGLAIFVSNARPELASFYQPPQPFMLDSSRMALAIVHNGPHEACRRQLKGQGAGCLSAY